MNEQIPSAGFVHQPLFNLARRLQIAARIVSLTVFLVGAGHLVAWFSGRMATLGISTITMKTNAALGLMLSGLALFLLIPERSGGLRLRFGRVMASLAALIGILTFTENVTGWNLGIDQLLATEQAGALAVVTPNRMGVPASMGLVLVGLALLLMGRRTPGSALSAQSLALGVSLISLLGTIGHLYGALGFYAIAPITGIAWPTALSFLMLGSGLLLARPEQGLMSQVIADDPGGANLRRWLPVLLMPLVLGWLRLEGERARVFDAPAGTAMVMIIFIVALAVVAYTGARGVSRSSLESATSAAAVQHERDRLSALLESINDEIWFAGADKKLTLVNQAVNREFGSIVARGSRVEEVAGSFEVYRADGSPRPVEEAPPLRALRGETIRNEVETVRTPATGELRHRQVSSAPVRNSGGAIIGSVSVVRDITELKRAEEALQKSVHELERSNRDLEQFAYICAHDLQEPLRQVRAYVNLITDRHADKLEGKAGQYFHFVHEGAARMSSLVSGLLDYSRVGGRLHRRTFPCREAVDSAIANLQTSITEAGAIVSCGELPTVTADTVQFVTLFQNLIGNAVKFRHEGVCPEIDVGCRRDGPAWVFWVKDNGIGINPEHRDRIFLIFQTLHGRDKYTGTGIGLAICKKIVEQHGGKIWIESSSGTGTTFFFSLPEG